jgi:hypothetical protein
MNQRSNTLKTRDILARLEGEELAQVFDDYADEDLHAVLIAIDEYQNSCWESLDCAVKDARKFKSLLVEQLCFKEKNIETFLVNEEATFARIKKTINHHVHKKGASVEKGALVVFFSGHGLGEQKDGDAGWVPYDGVDPKDGDNFITYQMLEPLINHSRYRHVVIISDCCFSARMVHDGMKTKGGAAFEPVPSEYLSKSRCFVGSSYNRAVIDEFPKRGHSPFIAFLDDYIAEHKEDVFFSPTLLVEFIKQKLRGKPEEFGQPFVCSLLYGDSPGSFWFKRADAVKRLDEKRRELDEFARKFRSVFHDKNGDVAEKEHELFSDCLKAIKQFYLDKEGNEAARKFFKVIDNYLNDVYDIDEFFDLIPRRMKDLPWGLCHEPVASNDSVKQDSEKPERVCVAGVNFIEVSFGRFGRLESYIPKFHIMKEPVAVADFAVFMDSEYYKKSETMKDDEMFRRIWTRPGVEWLQNKKRNAGLDLADPEMSVRGLSWFEAVAYCNWRSMLDSRCKLVYLPDGRINERVTGYRLPSTLEFRYIQGHQLVNIRSGRLWEWTTEGWVAPDIVDRTLPNGRVICFCPVTYGPRRFIHYCECPYLYRSARADASQNDVTFRCLLQGC